MSHKEAYEKSVDHLNTMFATTTLLGALASFGVFVHIPMGLFVMDIFDILYIILYIIGEIVYFYSINRVRKSITHIQTTIFSGNFIKRYLSRQPFQESSLDIHPSMKSLKDMDAESDIGSISYSINRMSKHVACISTNISDTMTSTDWLIMSKLMDIPWKNFTLVGFQVENIGFINRIGAVIFGLLMASGFLSMMDLHLGSK
ncbi:MAG: hypothetical protein Hyperionvirus15_47 [Hyperionvirus sp.]|uniref:Uncharacterized protein n=1 Tax=Hyperionvirus sp. TaxID=2487770 RepID=A0A3G5AF56_9VIRU|nr:MAG: hypothetical protein Hyperionvirus15_47 [Hyperionvirus sp.]